MNIYRKSESGFTLVEIMVVIVIIGILAAIAIPNFQKAINNAKKSELISNMHTVQFQVEMYSVDNKGKYPPVVDPILPELPENIKNPFDAANPVLQNESESDVIGVVEYRSLSENNYKITGIGIDRKGIEITLIAGQP